MPHDAFNPQSSDLLVIEADPDLAEELQTALAGEDNPVHVRHVSGALMAIGEAGRVDVPAPIAVICPLDALNGQAIAVTAALREVAPDALLIVVTNEAEEDDPQTKVFDACVRRPLQPDALAAALDAAARRSESNALQVTATASPFALTEPFDIAVIDELINPHGQPQEAALALITARSGVSEVRFTPLQEEPPPDHVRVSVARMDQAFGYLHAPAPASTEALQPWADWLARWLLLHRQQQDLWFMAMRDELTGAWNRRYFNRFLRMVLKRAEADRSTVTVLLFDIDDFKQYNDRFGHAAGDDILRDTVALMKSVVRDQDVVARIGGDEFAVIFWDAEAPRRANSRHPTDVLKIAERFRKAMQTHQFPKLASIEAPLSVSGGLASYPWDGKTPDDLIAKADAMASQAKREGKNAIRFGPA